VASEKDLIEEAAAGAPFVNPAAPGAPPVSAADDAESYPPRVEAYYALFVLSLALMVNFLDRGIINLLVEPIKRDLALSDTQMGVLIGTAFTLFYIVFGLPVAKLADTRNRKILMSLGVTAFALATTLTGRAVNFWQLFLCRVGAGVGETTSGPCTYSLIADYFPREKLPHAIALLNFGFVAGNTLAPIIGAAAIQAVSGASSYVLPVLGEVRDWQLVLMMVGAPGLIVAGLMLTIKEPVRRGGPAEAGPFFEVFPFVARHWKIFMPLFFGLALRSVQMFGVAVWAAPFYGRTFGWSPQQVGYVSGLSILISMPIGLLIGSWWAERMMKAGKLDANIRITVISTAASVPLALAMPLMPDPWLAAGCSLIAAALGGMAAPLENAAVQSVTPNRLRGQVTFLFLFIMNVIGMGLGPVLVGLLTDEVFGVDQIRWSIFTASLILGPPAIFVFWAGQKPYRRAMELVTAGGHLK
jgi:MFS family permease